MAHLSYAAIVSPGAARRLTSAFARWTPIDIILACISLLKLRIVALLLFVAMGSAYVAARRLPDFEAVALLLITGAMAAGGAGALNHYLERDLDAVMQRTKRRPLVSGRIREPRVALWLGLSLIVLSLVATLPLNAWLALFLFSGALIYVVVYTLWLKRRSRWNIVVGGAAGSCAILAGWAVAGPWWAPQPLMTALLVFLWTPPHFWSLATARLDDYRRGGVPMMPVVAGPRAAAMLGLAHVLLADVISLALIHAGSFGALYVGTVLAAGSVFTGSAALLAITPRSRVARLHFLISLAYLPVLFAGMVLDTYLHM